MRTCGPGTRRLPVYLRTYSPSIETGSAAGPFGSPLTLRACECFEVPLLLTPCWWRKRRWPVSPSYFAVGERRWWERAEATFRVTSPQGLGPPPRCVCLAHQRPPTQEVVGYGDKKHNGGDFGQSSYAELGYSVKTYLGIRPFGYRAPLPVDGFGLLGGHPLPPPHYLRSILIAGLVALMLRPVPREPYRRVHAHRSLLQSSDVLPCSKAAVHEVGLSNYLKMARRHCRRNHRSAHASCNTPR